MSSRPRPRSLATVPSLGLLLALGTACVSTSAGPTGMLAQSENVTADGRQLLTLINDFSGLWVGAVEWRADLIRASTEDADVQRNALVWKINATGDMLRATSHSDPLIAFLDAWALVFQFRDYFADGGAGAEMFGEHTDVARELSDMAVQEFEVMAARMANADGVLRGREVAADFAARAPIANAYFVRRSVADDLVAELSPETRNAFAELNTITQTVESLGSRVSLYMTLLPKQVRWQAELLLEEPGASAKAAAALENVNSIDATATRIADILDRAVDRTVPDAAREITATLQQEVEAVRELVSAERDLVLNQLPEEYRRIFAEVTEQRLAAVADIQAQLDRALDRIDTVAERSLVDAEGLTRGTVDYAFEKATPLLIGAFLGALILILVYRFVPQRVRTD